MRACLTPVLLVCLAALTTSCGARSAAPTERVLRVCADPNNLPYSNQAGEGFENELAQMVARELNARVEYTWWAQRRGYVRNTLRSESCDVLMGMPASMELAMATRPYYRSSYVFVMREGEGQMPQSLDDPILRERRVGVQIIGDDYSNAPPAHALANRGIVRNVRGYSVYGDYTEANPPSRIMRALADGEIDIAVVWGPLAGYFASRQRVPLRMAAVNPQVDLPFLPMVFDMSMGVRREDGLLRDELDEVLLRLQPEIDALLDRYGIPRFVSGELYLGTGRAVTEVAR